MHTMFDIPELVSGVIDQLADNRGALQSCSLVSHSWFPWARCRLFERIYIKGSCRAPKEFLRALQRASDSESDDFKVVRHLHFTHYSGPLHLKTICKILNHLDRLQSLHFHNVKLKMARKPPPFIPYPNLIVTYDSPSYASDYYNLCRLVTSVEQLRIYPETVMCNRRMRKDGFSTSPIGVRSLSIRDTHNGAFTYLNKIIIPEELRSLRVNCNQDRGLWVLESFLSRPWPNLQDFDFSIYSVILQSSDGESTSILARVLLSSCKTLRTLTLRGLVACRGESYWPFLFDILYHALKGISSLEVATVVVVIWDYKRYRQTFLKALRNIPWTSFREIIVPSHIRTVVISLQFDIDNEPEISDKERGEILTIVQEHLSKLIDEGRVRVETIVEEMS